MASRRRRALLLAAFILIKRRQQRRMKAKKCWMKHWVSRRVEQGAYCNLLMNLDKQGYRNYLRLSKAQFNDVLKRVSPLLERDDTVFRRSISAGERLALTLRFLGNVMQKQTDSIRYTY